MTSSSRYARLAGEGVAGEAFVRRLMERGARLDLKDASGRTALDIAPGSPASAPAGRGGRGGAGGHGGLGPAPAIDAATITLLRGLGLPSLGNDRR